MVAVAADDVAGVLVHQLAKAGVFVPILPTRCGHDDKESHFVAGIHERGIHRIVGTADDGHPRIAQPTGIAPLLTVGHGIAHISEVLMTITAYQLMIALAVQPKSILALEFKRTDAYTRHATVKTVFSLDYT